MNILNTVSSSLSKDSYNARLVSTYGNLSYYYLFSKKFTKSIEVAKQALAIDPTQVWIKTNLAHALLFSEQYEEAKTIYNSIKNIEDKPEKRLFSEVLLDDFDVLEKNGITHKKIKKSGRC